VLLTKIATAGIVLITILAANVARAQDKVAPQTAQTPTTAAPSTEKQPPASEPPPKETWNGPFGGSFTATFAFVTDYSYRGISQTQRQVAVQPAFGYETAPVSEKVPLSAYVGAWGSSIYFPNTPAWAEIDLNAGLRLKPMEGKLTVDLGYTRYNYLGAPGDLFFDFNEFSLVVGYDFGVAQVSGAVRYSPNFFANSGVAWYKWGQVAVPLSFINFNENVTFKVFGTVGNQYVERFANYGIGYNNYWDWQIGIGATVYGFDLSVAYVDTNLDSPNCGNTMNCDARAIFTISKTF
jgi:uncharacterized protein (TIGR02001 family)